MIKGFLPLKKHRLNKKQFLLIKPSNNSASNTLMGKTGSRKRKQTDGQTGGRSADIRSFMQKPLDRDKT